MRPHETAPPDHAQAGQPRRQDPLSLPASLDLTGADALRTQLQDCLASHDTVLIDGSAVERVSTACLQVLVAARTEAGGQGQSFTLTAMSTALGSAVRDLGLLAALGVQGAEWASA